MVLVLCHFGYLSKFLLCLMSREVSRSSSRTVFVVTLCQFYCHLCSVPVKAIPSADRHCVRILSAPHPVGFHKDEVVRMKLSVSGYPHLLRSCVSGTPVYLSISYCPMCGNSSHCRLSSGEDWENNYSVFF